MTESCFRTESNVINKVEQHLFSDYIIRNILYKYSKAWTERICCNALASSPIVFSFLSSEDEVLHSSTVGQL